MTTRQILRRLDARAVSIDEPYDLSAFIRPMLPLPPRVERAIQNGVISKVGPRPDGPSATLAPDGDGLGDGVYRLADGRLVVSCLTQMLRVEPVMWDWWFGWHLRSSARYRLWHPQEHLIARIADPAPADAPLRSRYEGKVSFVDEHIGPGPVQKLAIAFEPPEAFGLSPQRVAELGTAICARTWLREPGTAVGRLMHLVRRTEGGSEMLSRFWLGDVDTGNDLLNRFANTRWVRRRLLPDRSGLFLLRHCSAEMSHLAQFLPELHARFGGE